MTLNIKPIYIAFGANLSNPKETFVKAIAALAERGVQVVKMSSLWQSPSWPVGQGFPMLFSLDRSSLVPFKYKKPRLQSRSGVSVDH